MNNEQCTIFAQTERSSQIHLDDAEVQPKITQKRSGCVMNNVQWRKVKLGEVVVPLKGKLTEQSDCFHDDWKSLINTTAIDGESKTWANPINAVLCEPDDVLMLWDGERSGLVITGKQGVVGSTFARLRPNHELDGKYLYFFLLNNFEWIQNRRTGTGVPHAPKDLMRIFQISYPESLPAQRRIAAILASADKVIAATQKTIAKYKQIKQGMMEDLLNEQCTMNNVQWRKVKLGECCESELGKTLDEGRNTGLYRPYLCALNVLWGKIDRSTIKRMRIEDSELERYLVKKGDLLVCEGGEIGRCAIWDYDDVIYYQNALHRVRFYDGYDARFFMYLLCHYNDLKLIEQYGKGLTIKHLNQTAFRNIPVCVPDLAAQRRIATILSGIDAKIAAEEKVLEKYEKVKKGLMEKLLDEKCEIV